MEELEFCDIGGVAIESKLLASILRALLSLPDSSLSHIHLALLRSAVHSDTVCRDVRLQDLAETGLSLPFLLGMTSI